jgi:hypothetical protein
VDADGITKGYANAILNKLIIRANAGKATIKQMRALKRLGYDPIDWSFEQAQKKIAALAAVGWQRWRLHD